MKKSIVTLFFLFICNFAISQVDTTSLWDMSLEELLNLEVNIASSSKTYTIKEAPAVVSVISEQEIKNMGARDLIDVLKTLPSFDFGTDVNGVVSLIYRGIWVQEGKALLMIDGQMLNELMYSCIHLGNLIPVENIKRIEILRGPGSATYGDCAEMLVINIITKDIHKDTFTAGTSLSGTSNILPYRTNFFIGGSKKINELHLNFFGRYSDVSRSNFDYTDNKGMVYNMSENKIQSILLNFKAHYKNLSIISIINNYNLKERDHFGQNLSKPYPNNFHNYLAEISYSPLLSNVFKLSNTLNFKYDIPWHHEVDQIEDADKDIFSNLHFEAMRIKARSLLIYDKRILTMSLGFELSHDYSKTYYDKHWNGKDKIIYYTVSGIGQLSYLTRLVNIIVETRYDKHNLYGGAFAPRIAFTKDFGVFNYKMLWNRAFRAPSIDVININYELYPNFSKPQIKPEIASVTNLQIGTIIKKFVSIDIGLFYNKINNPIIYIYTSNGEGYDNYKSTGSNGFEVEISFKQKEWFLRSNYSYYSSKDFFSNKFINQVPDYFVIINNDTLDLLLGAPKHKISAFFSINIYKNFILNINTNYISYKYGYSFNKEINLMDLEKINGILNANIILTYQKFLKYFDLQIGIYNLFNTKNYFIQPYNGGHTPIPDGGREFLLKTYFNF